MTAKSSVRLRMAVARGAQVGIRAVTFYSKFEYSFEGGVKSSNSKCNSPFEL